MIISMSLILISDRPKFVGHMLYTYIYYLMNILVKMLSALWGKWSEFYMCTMKLRGTCKMWTVDSGLDWTGLDLDREMSRVHASYWQNFTAHGHGSECARETCSIAPEHNSI